MNKHQLLFPVIVALLPILSACNSHPATVPVTGTVKFEDGTPLAGGTVEFRNVTTDIAKQINARGEIGPDGKYQLTSFEPNDGAIAGEHQVCVFPPAQETPGSLDSEPPPSPLERKYQAYETSGLSYTVKADGKNEYNINVGKKVLGSK
jgi:hypothetical protein